MSPKKTSISVFFPCYNDEKSIEKLVEDAFSVLRRTASDYEVIVVDCDFRLIRREFLRKLNLKSNSGSICVELVKKAQRAGGKFRQVSVHHFEIFGLWFQLMVKDRILHR